MSFDMEFSAPSQFPIAARASDLSFSLPGALYNGSKLTGFDINV